jgi:hypothetical protein
MNLGNRLQTKNIESAESESIERKAQITTGSKKYGGVHINDVQINEKNRDFNTCGFSIDVFLCKH